MASVLCRRWLPLVGVAALSSACATTSTLELPSCTRRLEVVGEHGRAGRTLTFDHALDPPWSTTKIVLQGPEGTSVVERPNRAPDVVHLAAGCGLGAVGCGAGALGVLGAAPLALAAGGALALGGAGAALTGWHPADDDEWDLEAWCHDAR